MKKRAKSGDIFTEQLKNGQYMFGHVQLDIKELLKKGFIVRGESILTTHSICYCVSVYDSICDEPILPDDAKVVWSGSLVGDSMFENDSWTIIGQKPVNPKKIEFPEEISIFQNEITFEKGEVRKQTKQGSESLNRELIPFTVGLLNGPNLFDTVLTYMGRKDLVKHHALDIANYDKRFIDPNLRKRIFELFNEDPEMPYYDFALKHGFDTERFFKDAPKKTKPETMDYNHLLSEVLWSFIGEKYVTLEDFDLALEENDTELPSGVIFDQPVIHILCEYVDEQDKDHEIEVVFQADNQKDFEAKELLFKLHNELVEALNDNDFHFFEGLRLLKPGKGWKPYLYSVALGN